MSEQGIARLAESIKRNGVIQPIVVRPSNEGRDGSSTSTSETQRIVKYELIAGERRWRAARKAGLAEVPVIVRDATDQQLLELALVENIQREDLNAIDRALAYQQFREQFGFTAEQIGQTMGEDRTTVTNYLRLLDLPETVQDMLSGDLLSMGHARALAGVRRRQEQLGLAEAAVRKSLSVRALEDLIRRRRDGVKPQSAKSQDPHSKRPLIRDLERRFTQALRTKVTIQESRRKNHGKIVIEYNSVDEFESICGSLGL